MNESKNVNYSQVLNINGFTNTDNNLFVYDKALDEVFEYSSIPLKYPPFLIRFYQ